MNNSCPVSVLIPTYNSSRFIDKSIQSVLEQTLAPLEVIVVDDGSTDDTGSIIRAFGDQVTYVLKSNGGPSSARNVGMRLAQGRYIAFLDSDDIWERNKLELFTEALRVFQDKSPGMVFSDLSRWDHFSGEKFAKKNSEIYPYIANYADEQHEFMLYLTRDRLFELLVRKYAIFPSTLMISKSIAETIEWPENRSLCEDFYFNLLLSQNSDAVYVDRALSRLVRHDSNLSIDYKKLEFEEIVVLDEFRKSQKLSRAQNRRLNEHYERRLCGVAYQHRNNAHFGAAIRTYIFALRYPRILMTVLRGSILTLLAVVKSKFWR